MWQPAGDKYDLLNIVFLSITDTAGEKDHTCLFRALCELIDKIRFQWRRVQAHGIPSVKV